MPKCGTWGMTMPWTGPDSAAGQGEDLDAKKEAGVVSTPPVVPVPHNAWRAPAHSQMLAALGAPDEEGGDDLRTTPTR